MKIVYRISEQDFMAARDLFIANEKPWYRRFSRLLLPWVGALVLLMQVFYIAVVPHRDIGFSAISLMLGFYLLYCDSRYASISDVSTKRIIASNMTSLPRSRIKASTSPRLFPKGF